MSQQSLEKRDEMETSLIN